MSFVIAAPEFVTAAAGDLAEIGSALGAANAAAALPTTGVVAAAADEVSTGIAAMFGTFAQRYQALSAQAAAFHNEFVSLLNGGAAAYLSAEAANAQQTLQNAVTAPATTGANFAANAAATNPILGGLGSILGSGTTTTSLLGSLPPAPSLPNLSQVLGGAEQTLSQTIASLPGVVQGLESSLQGLLAGLFPQSTGGVGAYPNPYQVLAETTVINLNSLANDWAAHPFPILNQVIINQNHYSQIFWNGVAVDLQGFPANVPANIQLAIQGASTFKPAAMGQLFVNGTTGYWETVGTSLQNFGSAIQGTLPTFEYQMGQAGTAISTGNYHTAVQDAAHSFIDLFISGYNTSQMVSTATLTTTGVDIGIAGPIFLLGPAGDLLPILTATGQQVQGLASLFPAGSIPAQMAQNFGNGVATLTNGNVSASFTVNLDLVAVPPSAALVGTAFFGLPLQLGFALLGPPFAAADGLATGATAFSTALQTGNALGALNAIGDTPAYILNGLLNGQVLVDEPLPVTVTVAGVPVPITAVAHLPLDGLLVPPQPITATVPIDVDILGVIVDTSVTTTLGGTEFGGILPLLLNTMPQQIAAAISYQNS